MAAAILYIKILLLGDVCCCFLLCLMILCQLLGLCCIENWDGCKQWSGKAVFGRKRSRHILMYYPNIWVDGLNKTMVYLSQNNQFAGWNSNPACLECEAGMQTTTTQCLTLFCRKYGCEYVNGKAYYFSETQRSICNNFAAETSGRKTIPSRKLKQV